MDAKGITKEQADAIKNVAEEVQARFKKEAKSLLDRMMQDGMVGTIVAREVFRNLAMEAENAQTNTFTTQAYIELWVKNFAHGLKKGYFDNVKDFAKGIKVKDSLLVVGAGPSLTEEVIESLHKYKGTIYCVNKSLDRLLKHGIVPTVVGVVHSTDEVLPHFETDLVRKHMKDINVIASNQIHPSVQDFIVKYADPEKLFWFHADIVEDFAANVDNVFLTMVKMPRADTGGNVGVFGVAVGERLEAKHIGLVGMDLCFPLEWLRNYSESMESNIVYCPEDKLLFVIPTVFRGYIQCLMNWYGDRKKNKLIPDKFEILNCTPNGLIYVRRNDWIPYLSLDDFMEKFD